MGEMHLFTPEQKLILDQIKKSEFLRSNFYFTGGTALSYFYLQHRYSEDMDFFSEKEFDQEKVLSTVRQWANKNNFTFGRQLKEVVQIFDLQFTNGKRLKIDFGYYPYRRVEKGLVHEGVEIDSLIDIAINKLSSVNQRSQVKDFVDLYFLLKKFTIWDLIEGVRIKFRMELEPWIELKNFFRQKAKELGRKAVK